MTTTILETALPPSLDKDARARRVITAAAARLTYEYPRVVSGVGVAQGYAVPHTAACQIGFVARIDDGVVSTRVVSFDEIARAPHAAADESPHPNG